MDKSQYIKVLKKKLADELKQQTWLQDKAKWDSLPEHQPKKITQLDIDENKILSYCADNIEKGKFINNNLDHSMNWENTEGLHDAIGGSNIDKLPLKKDELLIQVIVKFPRHGVLWHNDLYNQWHSDAEAVRYWFSVLDQHYGHFFQISNTSLQYNKGEVYMIPRGIGHCSANSGFSPQVTCSITGVPI